MLSFLAILSTAQANCSPDDGFEENDDASSAAALTAGSHTGLQICYADEDWFSIQGTAGERLNIDATFIHAQGDIDIYLYDANNTEDFLVPSSSVNDNESIEYIVETTGTYLIKARYFTNDENNNSYDLSVSSSVMQPCPEDSYSTNVDPASAAPLELGTHTLVACNTEYFTTTGAVGQYLYAEALFSSEDGDLDLQIQTLEGETLDSSASITDDELAATLIETEDSVLIEVKLYNDKGDIGIPYQLSLYMSDEEPEDSNDWGYDTGGEPASEPATEPASEPTSEPASDSSDNNNEEAESDDDIVIDSGEKASISCNNIGLYEALSPTLLLGLILGIRRRIQ
ncbi:MAG: hypothetical protein CMK59_01210 [Proteobacteria bacterium]|nr:hypothetical protein [Pseudomonadota bacterium]